MVVNKTCGKNTMDLESTKYGKIPSFPKNPERRRVHFFLLHKILSFREACKLSQTNPGSHSTMRDIESPDLSGTICSALDRNAGVLVEWVCGCVLIVLKCECALILWVCG